MAVSMSVPDTNARLQTLTVLSQFRCDFYACLSARGDELFELTEALLCTDGPVKTLVDLALAPEHRRGHGALYDGINHGRINLRRFQATLAALPLPRTTDGRLMLAVDITCWLRPDAPTSAARSFCHTYGRGKDQHLMIPGWPYSIIAALEPGRTSWTALLDAARLTPGADVAATTAGQVRTVLERLIRTGQWAEGDQDILLIVDAGYDVPRLAFLLADLPVQVLGRMRSDRVLYRSTPSRRYNRHGGRPAKHGDEFSFGDPATWGEPGVLTVTATLRYGTAVAMAFDRLHPRLTRRSAWENHPGDLPVIEGTVIRLQVDHLPSGGEPKPVWLWWSGTDATAAEVDRLWQAFLRRFDLEHTFRMIKQTLGWTRPKLRTPEAADRWTWLIIAAHTQLRLARELAQDLRRPWERPTKSGRLTPARVRRGFRNLREKTPSPASAPKPGKPGPGRPVGSKNRSPAPRHDVGRGIKTDASPARRKPKTSSPRRSRPKRKG
jgi:DDE superfamily endonuclease